MATRDVALDARRSPQVRRIIVWDKFFDETVEHKDRLESLLGPNWKIASEQNYNVRFHWNWSDLYVYRRTEYVKK